jgi:hypothetical protein
MIRVNHTPDRLILPDGGAVVHRHPASRVAI